MSKQVLQITKSWRWSGAVTAGWKALAILVTSSPNTQTRQRIIISHANAVAPRVDETMAVECKPGTDEPNWDVVLRMELGSVSPRRLFPNAEIQIDTGVEELWNES